MKENMLLLQRREEELKKKSNYLNELEAKLTGNNKENITNFQEYKSNKYKWYITLIKFLLLYF